jgi:acyl carrier protein
MKFNLRHWSQLFPQAAQLPLLREMAAEFAEGTPPRAAGGAFRAALLAAAPETRRALLEQHLLEQIAQVLRADAERLSIATPFNSMGMDSLMALELRNRLELSLGLSLPATLVWGRPTVADLAPDLAQRLGLSFEATHPVLAPEPAVEPTVTALDAAAVSDLSDAAAEDLLAQKLAALGKEFLE